MYVLQVEGMTCGGCANRVTKAVQSVDNNAQVSIDLPSKKVNVESEAEIGLISSAITVAGYPATASSSR